MVVILSSAAIVFWMEYRRFVRTRRCWVYLLTALILGGILTLGMTALTWFAPKPAANLLGLSYTAVVLLGALTGLPSILAQPLATRIMTDTYKTHTLTDLYLTELHPLGVLLGRVWATVAFTGLSLLTLTPFALWLCALLGVSAWTWWASALLALVSYMLVASAEAYAWRENHPFMPKTQADLRTRVLSGQAATILLPVLAWLFLGLSALMSLETDTLNRLPVWALSPYTAPLLVFGGQVQPMLIGFAFALGTASWLLLCAAQWRDWWSDAVYRWMRWGGTAFWILGIGWHTNLLATVFVNSAASAERFLLFTIFLTALLNLAVAPLMGYYGLARRPKPLRLPYPLGGLMWQWALQWMVALTLYLTVGLATGRWVALEQWLLWAVYAWVGMTFLGQAWFGAVWSYMSRAPTHLQGDYYCGWLMNNFEYRAVYYKNGSLAASGAGAVLSWYGILFLATLVLRLVNSALGSVAPLNWLIDWLMRVHPWWGFYREWMGVGDNWVYVWYALALAVVIAVWRGRRGLYLAQHAHEEFQLWQKQVESERLQREATS